MSYRAKVLGTRYVVELKLEFDQWVLRLFMDSNVEDTLVLDNLTKKDLKAGISSIISEMQMELNPFQKEKILQDLVKGNPTMFTKNASTIGRKSPDSYIPSPASPAAEASSTPATPQDPETVEGAEPPKSGKQYHSNNNGSKSATDLQNVLLSEYKGKIQEAEKIEVKQIEIQDLQSHDDDKSQLDELVRSHREVQNTLKQLDQRVASLERLSIKLVEITEVLLERAL